MLCFRIRRGLTCGLPLEQMASKDPARRVIRASKHCPLSAGCDPPNSCQYPSFWNPVAEGGLPYNKLDAVTMAGDAISRVAAFSLSTNTAELVDTTGLVTHFQFDPVPSLKVR